MRLINPSYKMVDQEPGLEGIYKQIELAARNCYRSNPVEGISSKDFVERMIKLGHLSTLEHGTVYLRIGCYYTEVTSQGDETYFPVQEVTNYEANPYSKVNYRGGIAYITTNLRVLVENNWLDDLKYLCEPTEFHEKRVTVKFTSNIHFYKDITRHRPMSFAIESTRYCNYSKGKFGNELTFIIPVWMDNIEYYKEYYGIPGGDEGIVRPSEDDGFYTYYLFLYSLLYAEEHYLGLIEHGWQAQQAAEVLPQATKADIIMTGFVSDWNHVFDSRARGITGKPHPEVLRLMEPLMGEFYMKNLIK